MEFTKIKYQPRKGYYDVYIYFSKAGKILWHPTNVKVLTKDLTKKGTISSSHPNYNADKKSIASEQARVETVIQEYFDKYREKPDTSYVVEQLGKPVELRRTKRDSDMVSYMEDFLIHKAEVCGQPDSVKVYRNLKTGLVQFRDKKNRNLSFENLDQTFITDFSNFLLNDIEDETRVVKKRPKGNNNNTVTLRLKHFLEFTRWCKLEKDIAVDTDKVKYWMGLVKKKEGIKSYRPGKMVLELEEVDELHKWDKHKKSYEKFKDVFVFCCRNGLRISDNNSLKKYHMLGQNLKKNTIKTGTQVKLEVDKVSLEILKKYDYDLSVCSADYNRDIKVVLKDFFEYYKPIFEKKFKKEYPLIYYKIVRKGKEEIVTQQHKAEFFASHNARATSITNQAKGGEKLHKIMKEHGHTDLRTTLGYIHDNNVPYELE